MDYSLASLSKTLTPLGREVYKLSSKKRQATTISRFKYNYYFFSLLPYHSSLKRFSGQITFYFYNPRDLDVYFF